MPGKWYMMENMNIFLNGLIYRYCFEERNHDIYIFGKLNASCPVHCPSSRNFYWMLEENGLLHQLSHLASCADICHLKH